MSRTESRFARVLAGPSVRFAINAISVCKPPSYNKPGDTEMKLSKRAGFGRHEPSLSYGLAGGGRRFTKTEGPILSLSDYYLIFFRRSDGAEPIFGAGSRATRPNPAPA